MGEIMSKRLDGMLGLVTGASSGIGRAIALGLASEGAFVILNGRDKSKLAEVEREIIQISGQTQAAVIAADLEQEREVLRLAAAVQKQYGRLDILINSAGLTLSSTVEATATGEWDRLMAVNARAPFLLCRELVELLKQSEAGRIVNISSVVGVKGYALQCAYTASKHALRGFSIALAEELNSSGVRVHVICPGGVDTPMVSRVRPDIAKEDLISPEEIADWAVMLCCARGNGVVDEIRIRRAVSGPWF